MVIPIAEWVLEQQSLSKVEFTNNNVQVYPNPADRILNIKNRAHKFFKVRIFDLTGKLVQSMDLKANLNSISIPVDMFI